MRIIYYLSLLFYFIPIENGIADPQKIDIECKYKKYGEAYNVALKKIKNEPSQHIYLPLP